MMVAACHPNTQETEVVGLQVQGQPGLHGETLSQKRGNEHPGYNRHKRVLSQHSLGSVVNPQDRGSKCFP